MNRRRVYTLIVALVAALGLLASNVAYTNLVDQRRAASDRRQRAADEKVAQAVTRERDRIAAQTKARMCSLITAMQAVYDHPETQTGRDAQLAWQDLATQFGC